jgi:hypothetical protein
VGLFTNSNIGRGRDYEHRDGMGGLISANENVSD